MHSVFHSFPPGTWMGNWIGSGTVWTRASIHLRCWHRRQLALFAEPPTPAYRRWLSQLPLPLCPIEFRWSPGPQKRPDGSYTSGGYSNGELVTTWEFSREKQNMLWGRKKNTHQEEKLLNDEGSELLCHILLGSWGEAWGLILRHGSWLCDGNIISLTDGFLVPG